MLLSFNLISCGYFIEVEAFTVGAVIKHDVVKFDQMQVGKI
jgi:hypothetical protein